jgi:alanyl-tRNA synthetase
MLSVCAHPQGVPNNYETDLIFPIVAQAAELAGIDYAAAPPAAQTALKVRSAGANAASICRH